MGKREGMQKLIGGVFSGFGHNRGRFGLAIIRPGESAVVTTLGRVSWQMKAGLGLYIPLVQRVTTIDLRAQPLHVELPVITAKGQPMHVTAQVVAHVEDARVLEFMTKSTDPTEQLLSYVKQALLAAVREYDDVAEVLQNVQKISDSMRAAVVAAAARIGVVVDNLAVDKVLLPEDVEKSMSALVAARNNAEAEAFTRVRAAEARAQEDVVRAQGIADSRRAIAEGMGDSARMLKGTGVTAAGLMRWVLAQDELAMKGKFATENNTIFFGMDAPTRTAAVHATLRNQGDWEYEGEETPNQ